MGAGYIATFDATNWNNYLTSTLSESTLIIPDTLDGQPVKGIVAGDIFSSQQIQSLRLPQTMELIGGFAFSDNSLDSLNLSGLKALTTIGEGAFYENALTSLDLSNLNVLTAIGEFAFFNNFLSSFVLPPQVDGVIFQWTGGSTIMYSGDTVIDLERTYTCQVPGSSFRVTFNVSNNGVAVF